MAYLNQIYSIYKDLQPKNKNPPLGLKGGFYWSVFYYFLPNPLKSISGIEITAASFFLSLTFAYT